MKIPKQIQIAGHVYDVKKSRKTADKEHVNGKIYYDQCEILLCDDCVLNKQEREVSFLHECLHAIFFTLNYPQDEDRIVCLSELLYQVIKQIEEK